jgi:hypothetical protein
MSNDFAFLSVNSNNFVHSWRLDSRGLVFFLLLKFVQVYIIFKKKQTMGATSFIIIFKVCVINICKWENVYRTSWKIIILWFFLPQQMETKQVYNKHETTFCILSIYLPIWNSNKMSNNFAFLSVNSNNFVHSWRLDSRGSVFFLLLKFVQVYIILSNKVSILSV